MGAALIRTINVITSMVGFGGEVIARLRSIELGRRQKWLHFNFGFAVLDSCCVPSSAGPDPRPDRSLVVIHVKFLIFKHV